MTIPAQEALDRIEAHLIEEARPQVREPLLEDADIVRAALTATYVPSEKASGR